MWISSEISSRIVVGVSRILVSRAPLQASSPSLTIEGWLCKVRVWPGCFLVEGGLVVRSLEGGQWCPSSKDGVGQGTG